MSTLARIQTHRAATISVAILSAAFTLASAPVQAQQRGGNQPPPPDTLNDPVRLMVGPPRPREVQGDGQGSHPVRRQAPRHRTQPQGGGLDRGAAQELRLHADRADQVHLHDAAGARQRRRRGRQRSRPRTWPRERGAGRRTHSRHPHSNRRQHRFAQAARPSAPRARRGAGHRRPARRGVLHEGRLDAPRGDVHRRRSHGRPRLERGRERRRLRHRAGHGARAGLQQPRREDRSLDSVHPLEQRGDGHERRAGLHRAARFAAGQGRTRRARANIPSRSGSA